MKELLPLFLPIYLPIVMGFLTRLTGYFPEEFGHAIRQFCLKVTIPLLIFMSMVTMDSSAVSQVLPMVLSLPLYMGILWLAALLATMLPVFRTRRIEGVLVIILGNIGYFGWAVTNLSLGPEALTRNLMFTTLFWPMTILFSILSRIAVDRTLNGVRSALKTLKVAIPMLLAFAAGLAMKLAGFTIPPALAESLSAFSRMTVPLILFGAGLSVVFRAHWGILSLLLPLRLLLGLGAAWLTTRILGSLDSTSRSVILIVSQMPVAVNTLIMGDVMGLDEEFISGAITLSAVLALATIPLTLYLFA
jgi:predicted permease